VTKKRTIKINDTTGTKNLSLLFFSSLTYNIMLATKITKEIKWNNRTNKIVKGYNNLKKNTVYINGAIKEQDTNVK